MRRVTGLFLVLLIALTGAACGAISVDNGVVSVDINISEAMINNMLEAAIRSGRQRGESVLFDTVNSVELVEPDTIRVFGTGTENGEPLAGSYDLQIGAESGALKLAVTAVDVPGVSLDDPRVVQANEDMTKAFSDQIVSEGGKGVISSAEIQNGALQLRIDAPLN